MKSSHDTLKVTLLINPSNRDQSSLLKLVAGVSSYFKRLDKSVGWYFLPVSTESEIDLNYNKTFVCSVELDQGATYLLLTEVTKIFKTEKEIFEYLENRGKSTSKLKSCFQSKVTEKRIQELNVLARNPELNGARIIYNEEPESQVPGLIDLKNRVDQKLRIKKILAQ